MREDESGAGPTQSYPRCAEHPEGKTHKDNLPAPEVPTRLSREINPMSGKGGVEAGGRCEWEARERGHMHARLLSIL